MRYLLRSAVGKTHYLRSVFWWTIVHHKSDHKPCVIPTADRNISHHLPQVDCHSIYFIWLILWTPPWGSWKVASNSLHLKQLWSVLKVATVLKDTCYTWLKKRSKKSTFWANRKIIWRGELCIIWQDLSIGSILKFKPKWLMSGPTSIIAGVFNKVANAELISWQRPCSLIKRYDIWWAYGLLAQWQTPWQHNLHVYVQDPNMSCKMQYRFISLHSQHAQGKTAFTVIHGSPIARTESLGGCINPLSSYRTMGKKWPPFPQDQQLSQSFSLTFSRVKLKIMQQKCDNMVIKREKWTSPLMYRLHFFQKCST